MEKKHPTLKDAVRTLEQVYNELETVKSVVATFLDDYENFTLIPLVIEKAKKNNKGAVTPSWISIKFQKGYARSFRIVDLMLTSGLIKPIKGRTKNKFQII